MDNFSNFKSSGHAWITGTVKMLRPEKGYGFLRGVDGIEYFFHRESTLDYDTLTVGMGVRFVPSAGTQGPRATAVEPL